MVILTLLSLTSCGGGSESSYLLTKARLHNIKTVMPHLCEMVQDGYLGFPQTGTELVAFMHDEMGFKPPRDNDPRRSPVVDGWGQALRIQGDVRGYEIRSAGPDELFDSDDDIYLAGDYRKERIIDGVRAAKAAAK
jgi:hypothetical protein